MELTKNFVVQMSFLSNFGSMDENADEDLENDSELMAELLALQGETSGPRKKVPRTVPATTAKPAKPIDGNLYHTPYLC